MPVVPGPSASVNSMLNTLITNLPSVLTELWAIDDGTIQITFGSPPVTAPCPQPVGNILFLRHQHLVIPQYPAVEVYSMSGKEYADAAPQWGSWAHRLMVAPWLVGDSEEVVQEQLLRYVEAIWLVVSRNQALDGTLSGPHGVEANEYSIVYKPPPVGKVLIGAQMPVTVYVDEGMLHA